MSWLRELSPWIGPVAAAATLLAGFFWSLLHGWRRRAELRRLRAAFRTCWESYLEAVSISLRQLRSLRGSLTQVRPKSDEKALGEACRRFHDDTSREIAAIESQLKTLAHAPDSEWYAMSIDWTPSLEFHRHVDALLSLAQDGISKEKFEALRQDWQRENEAQLTVAREQHRRERAELEALVAKLEEDLKAARKSEKEARDALANMQPVEIAAPEKDFDEYAAAARLMAKLEYGLKLEDAEAKLAVADGEILFLQNKIADAPTDERLKGELAWAEQTKRWWQAQRSLARQSILLIEATDRANELAMEGEALRSEEVHEFQSIEMRNMELRNKLKAMVEANEQLAHLLDSFDAEKATAEELREMLARAEGARKVAERELNAFETMLDRLERDLADQQARNARMHDMHAQIKTQKERIEALEQSEVKAKKEVFNLRSQIEQIEAEHTRALSEEESEKRQLIRQMEAASAQAAASSKQSAHMVSEKEMMKLQEAYDHLNADLMRTNSKLRQVQNAEKAASDNFSALEHEHRELTRKYQEAVVRRRELERELADVSSQEVLEREMMQLQMQYDTLNTKWMKSEAALREAEAFKAEALSKNAKWKRVHDALAAKYAETKRQLDERPSDAISEEELMELQTAYDTLNAEMFQTRVALKRAEEAAEKATAEAEKWKRERLAAKEECEALSAQLAKAGA